MIYLFVGQPGSGKTTLAKALIEDCVDTCIHIDGDELRSFFKNTDYSKDSRANQVENIFNMVGFLEHKGFTVVISIVSPFIEHRENFKSRYPVTEIFLHTSEIRGREEFFVDYYEKPETNFIDIDTTNLSIEDSLKLINYNKKANL